MLIRSAEIVVANWVALPPRPATAARVVVSLNHCWPSCANWPLPDSVVGHVLLLGVRVLADRRQDVGLAPFAFGCG
jgi:hypothetical protein